MEGESLRTAPASVPLETLSSTLSSEQGRLGPANPLTISTGGYGLSEELLLPRLSTVAAREESIMFDHKNIQPQPGGLSTANTATVMDRWE